MCHCCMLERTVTQSLGVHVTSKRSESVKKGCAPHGSHVMSVVKMRAHRTTARDAVINMGARVTSLTRMTSAHLAIVRLLSNDYDMSSTANARLDWHCCHYPSILLHPPLSLPSCALSSSS